MGLCGGLEFSFSGDFWTGGNPGVGGRPDRMLWGEPRAWRGFPDRGATEGAGAMGGSPGLRALQGSHDPGGCGGSPGPLTGVVRL